MRHHSWDRVPLEELNSKISRKMITGDKVMVAQIFIKKGGVVPLHHHHNEQVSYIVEGALEFEMEGSRIVVHSGEVLCIPANVPHSAVALEDTVDLDIFTPPREDWLSGQDAYLRQG